MSGAMKRSSVNLVGTVDDLILELENERKDRAARKPATTYDVIRAIHPTLAGMKADGWTDNEVCDVLGKRGISISSGTFATYMKRLNKERREGKAKMSRKSRSNFGKTGPSDTPRAAGGSPVHQKRGAGDSTGSIAPGSSPSPVDSGKARPAVPTMKGCASRKPPSLDA